MGYFARIWSGIRTTAVGMKLTIDHFFRKPTTIQYPEEQPYFSPFERGIHEFEPDKCILCLLCVKACPVDCIDLVAAPLAPPAPTAVAPDSRSRAAA